ncbi:MAG: hypothetical protein WC378_04365 [Opitutaceae bacterium]|jgi:hypothetical protein
MPEVVTDENSSDSAQLLFTLLAWPADLRDLSPQRPGDWSQRRCGPREADNIAGHPTVDLPREHVKKLDDVVTELAAKGVTANRAFVVRAILRAARDGTTLASAVKKFLTDFPARPRGRAALKAKKHGRR